MLTEVVLREMKSGRTHRLALPCVIGRGAGTDLDLADAAVSRRHARLAAIGPGVSVEDLASRNGVFVNGARISALAPLAPGDTLRIGDTDLALAEDEGRSETTVILHSLDHGGEWNPDRQRLQALYDITAGLSETKDLEGFGRRLFADLKELLHHDRGYLARFQEDGTLKPVFSFPAMGAVPVSKSILRRVFEHLESFLLKDALSEEALRDSESIVAFLIRSALCVPIVYRNEIYGLLYLDSHKPGSFRQDDLAFLRSVASIVAPLMENARLWSELKAHHDSAVEELRRTEARLIDVERKAAYVHLAQAMAHEIRNPLMIVGGLTRMLARAEPKASSAERIGAIVSSVERIEAVLNEVDAFVSLPLPEKRLERIDEQMAQAIETAQKALSANEIRPALAVKTENPMVPLDPGLFRRMIFSVLEEVARSAFRDLELRLELRDFGKEIEICFGQRSECANWCGLFDPRLEGKPWSLALSLSVAHKIASDHGGVLLLDSDSDSLLPLAIRLPRTAREE